METVAIRERFERNLQRVRSLVALFSSLTGAGRGRASVEIEDILRSAVVLLHASLEDLLRGIANVRMPGRVRRRSRKYPSSARRMPG